MFGTTLSHQEITAKLGEGGKGEVDHARDTRLQTEQEFDFPLSVRVLF